MKEPCPSLCYMSTCQVSLYMFAFPYTTMLGSRDWKGSGIVPKWESTNSGLGLSVISASVLYLCTVLSWCAHFSLPLFLLTVAFQFCKVIRYIPTWSSLFIFSSIFCHSYLEYKLHKDRDLFLFIAVSLAFRQWLAHTRHSVKFS